MLAILVFHNKTRHPIMNLFTFSKHFKHVDVYMYDGNHWTGFRMGSQGIIYVISGFENGKDLIREAHQIPEAEAIIGIKIGERALFGWSGITIPMCNEFVRAITGIDIGYTWNPRNLHNKLLKYDGKRNYEIFYQWRRQNGILWR